jgi:16S rRNA (adenine1518-N6/adenine1519-N6)-dimethyltransferase
MLQEEVVDRLVAKPGGSDYGVLSVMAQYAAEITKAFRVSASCFRPRPEVGSAVASLKIKAQRELSLAEEPVFAALVKAAFAHRRKTLANSLRDEGYDPHRILGVMNELQIEPTVRAERLSVHTFAAMARRLSPGV